MALTKADLRTLTKQLVGNRVSATIDSTWYDTRVQSGYSRLCTFQGLVNAPGMKQPTMRRLGFFELQDTQSRSIGIAPVSPVITSNFITPSPATNVCVITDIYDRTHDRGLDRRGMRELRTRNRDATGIPRLWCMAGQGGVIGYYVDRIPALVADNIDVYEYVYKYPTALATDGVAPVIPDVWHIAIAYAAASEAAELLDMAEKHAELESKFLGYIAERKSPMEEAAHSGLAGTRRWTPIGMRI